MISPAREDFDESSPAELLVWPFVWCAIALLLLLGARSFRTPIGGHDAAHHPEGGHGR